MASSELKLVPGAAERSAAGPPRGGGAGPAVALGLLALACALAGTWLGADRARAPTRSVESARAALNRVLDRGPSDPGVLDAVAGIRSEIGQRPLDARTRVLYAALLLEMASGLEDCRAAAFHAGRAAELAPVTVPVIRAASMVLLRCGEQRRGLELIREMFLYEPDSAARLLTAVEPFADVAGLPDRTVPPDPLAWLAWSRQLREQGRGEEAERWAVEAHRRWPDHLETLRDAAARAAERRDWVTLGMLLPADGLLPDRREAAVLYAYRARVRAEAGDVAGARADVERAIALSDRSPTVLLQSGDALQAARDPDGARRAWRRALFELPAGDASTRVRVRLLVRLARLEDLHGEPAAALRAWRDVLKQEPDHPEARRRVGELDLSSR